MPFTYQDIDELLRKSAGLGKYYTLDGGAALIWHLKHRVTSDLDFYLEPGTWDEEKTPFLLFKAFESLVPTNELLKIVSHIKHSGMNVTKIHFEKGDISIIQNGPMTYFSRERITPPGRLPVATLREILLGKLAALGGRNRETDLQDLAHIFAFDGQWNVNDVFDEILSRAMDEFSYETTFKKLSETDSIEGIDETILAKIRNFGLAGLKKLSPDNISALS